MTYDTDPPRLRFTGDPDDSLVQALEAARLDLPNDEQLAALAAPWAPLGERARVQGFLSLGRARLRAKSLQAAAIALAAAVGVGATVMLRSGFPFAKAPVAETARAKLGSAQSHPVKPSRPESPAPVALPVEEPASAPPEQPGSTKSRAQGAKHAVSTVTPSSRPSQGDLPSSDLDGPMNSEAETALLGRAHQALASNPARALALTDEHRRNYSGGVLGQESDVIAIEALVLLGRTGEARSAATSFRTRYPSSAHLRRIDRLLGAPDAPAARPDGQ